MPSYDEVKWDLQELKRQHDWRDWLLLAMVLGYIALAIYFLL